MDSFTRSWLEDLERTLNKLQNEVRELAEAVGRIEENRKRAAEMLEGKKDA